MSSAKDCCSSRSVIALPPYLMTTVAPCEALQPGQRLDQGRGLAEGGAEVAAHEEYAEFSWT